jgi:transcriptional regulator with XRE-family HTH domain
MTQSKPSEINLPKFAGLLAKKRAGRPLRDLAQEIGGVSASTLSRIEKGNVPDLITFMKICRWLEVSLQDFLTDSETSYQPSASSTSDFVCAHLRADQTLPPDTAKALVTMIQLAYKDIISGSLDADDD